MSALSTGGTVDPSIEIAFRSFLRAESGAVTSFSAMLPNDAVNVTLEGTEDPDVFTSPSLKLPATAGTIRCASTAPGKLRCTLSGVTFTGTQSDGQACGIAVPTVAVDGTLF